MPLKGTDVVRAVARLSRRDKQLADAARGAETVGEPSSMESALLDAARVMQATDAPHALIGGLAVAVHTGHPRATKDVDFAVRSDVDLDALIAAFLATGFELRGRHEHSINLLHPAGDPVQLAFDPGFDAAIDRAESVTVTGTEVRIVGRADLIALKERAAADPARRRSKALRDQADVEMLRGDVPDPDEGW
jgi:hypothetical protein